jgi:pilus assembly protein CpaB
MRLGSLLLTTVGLSIAGGSVYVARDYLSASQGAAVAAPEVSTIEVLIANQDIEFGAEIEPQMLAFQAWPRDAVPPGAFTQLSAVTGDEQTEPRRARTKLYKGEVLLAPKLSNFGEKVTIVQSLGPNSRAISIKVTADTGVGGFVTPGDKVDVILTHGKAEELKTVTIIQNVRVIGVDQEANAEKEKPGVAKTVTLEVTAEDSQKLALAQKAGTLSLILRTVENEDESLLEAISLRDVLREPEPVAGVAPEEVTVRSVVVRRGIDETEDELK